MIEIALEASGRPGSVAARSGERLLELELSKESAHASDLMGALDGLFQKLDAKPGELSSVFVGVGPGSFTGLRVAIATAQGLARGTNARMRGVPSFEAFAFSALEPGQEAFIVCDAYSSELYLAHYRRESSEVSCITAPHVVAAGPLDVPPHALVFGDEKGLRAAGLADHANSGAYRSPAAGSVLELGAMRLAKHGQQLPESIEPLYLRPFAAKKRRR